MSHDRRRPRVRDPDGSIGSDAPPIRAPRSTPRPRIIAHRGQNLCRLPCAYLVLWRPSAATGTARDPESTPSPAAQRFPDRAARPGGQGCGIPALGPHVANPPQARTSTSAAGSRSASAARKALANADGCTLIAGPASKPLRSLMTKVFGAEQHRWVVPRRQLCSTLLALAIPATHDMNGTALPRHTQGRHLAGRCPGSAPLRSVSQMLAVSPERVSLLRCVWPGCQMLTRYRR